MLPDSLTQQLAGSLSSSMDVGQVPWLLTTWQLASPPASGLKERKEKTTTEATVLFGPDLQVKQHHFSFVPFVRTKLQISAHTQEEED